MHYKTKGDKIIINKDGVYFSLTPRQLAELKLLIKDIVDGTKIYYVEDSRSSKITIAQQLIL